MAGCRLPGRDVSVMSNPIGVIKRWTLVVGLFAVAIAGLAIWMVPWALEDIRSQVGRTDPTDVALIFMLVVATLLLGISLVALLKKKYRLGGMFALIGGVFLLPVGVILIVAGVRIRSAASALEGEAL